jgi:L-alanine-DL-glutamate epimerase-like enolase superfamily enzyme
MWARLADLSLVVEGYDSSRLRAAPAFGHQRGTDLLRLFGDGAEGLGEDITTYLPEGAPAPPLDLAGEWTLAGFCEHLAGLEQWTEAPQWDLARRWRNWGYESAALDLALRQAGRPLHEVLERSPRPVRFVNSFGLGDPPQFATLRRRRERYPDLRFKLDAEATWSAELLAEVAGTGAVETIDFKGQYGLEVKEPDALVGLYERVVELFPDAILEDPHDLPGIAEVLAPHAERVSYDAPIRSADDLASVPIPARIVNVKPSRIGGLRPLLELYAHCEAEGIRMYGGGMGELGVARGQIQLLASLFHPDAPNDVAPSSYNDEEPPDGLRPSPLEPRPAATGFRRAE